MKERLYIGLLLIMLLLIFNNISNAATIWVNPANPGIENGLTKSAGYKTLWKAMSVMLSGDTIIIANGNWLSYPNMTIYDSNIPPSGSTGNYSKIVAETDWEVRLPNISTARSRSYVEIRGIVFDSRTTPTGHIVYEWHHTKFIRCGFLAGKLIGNAHCCGFGSSDGSGSSNHHNLMEECVAWGGGRYMIYSKYGKYNIFRRCIVRHDNQEGGYNPNDDGQISNFRAYACDYHIYQNCISIDSDRVEYYNGGNVQDEAAGYWIGDQYTGNRNEVQGCISIKDIIMAYYLAGNGTLSSCNINNSIAINMPIAGYTTLSAFILKNNCAVAASNFLGMDAIQTGQDGFYGKNSGTFTVTNSIVKDVADVGINCDNTYINHYNAGSGYYGTGATNYDPEENGLLYPVRIEAGSNLATAGGGVCGPTILKKIGVSGTLYGEPGWDTVTNENLWPFPNEDKIKDLMSETVEGVSGVYGFTAYQSPFNSPSTLTSYIWEYLGNPLPSGIYSPQYNIPISPGKPGTPKHVDK